MGEAGKGGLLSRRDFLKLAGLGLGALALSDLLAACGPAENPLSVDDYLKWQDSLPESQRAENLIPLWLKRGIGRAHFNPLADYTGMQTSADGTAQVYMETPTDLVLTTAEHVGRFLWKDINVQFPYGSTNGSVRVDARIGAANGPVPTDSNWWIQNVTAHSEPDKGIFHPIRTIFIKKPKGFGDYVVGNDYQLLRAPSAEPKVGEKFLVGGFVAESNRLIASVLEYQRTTKQGEIPDAVIPMYQFKGFSHEGMSGSVIINGNGEVAGVLSRGGINLVLGIPFAPYQPIQEVNSLLNGGK